MNIQDWFPLGWTGLISLQSKGFSRVFSKTRFKSINSSVLSFLYSHMGSLGNSITVPQKIKKRTFVKSFNSTYDYCSKKIKILSGRYMLIEASFAIAKKWGMPVSLGDEWIKCGMHIQWNITQPYKRMKSYHLWQHGWTFRKLCKVK